MSNLKTVIVLADETLDAIVGGDNKAPPKPAPKPQPKISFDGVAGESVDDNHKDENR